MQRILCWNVRASEPKIVRFIKKIAKGYRAHGDLEDSGRVMSDDTSEKILHFLFVYYFSYHEAEESSGKRVDILSFSTWFSRLRTKLGRKMKKEVDARAKSYNALTGNARELYASRLKQWRKQWKATGS